MNKWRPKDWPVNPCNECEQKVEDNYGLFCDLSCGRHTQYINSEAGASDMLDALFKLAKESPTGTFTIDSKREVM